MPINQADFPAQSGDYSIIKNTITYDDALQFCAIFEAISAHAIATEIAMLEYVGNAVCVNLAELNLSVASVSTLKAVGLIISSDGVHMGLTPLGYGFYQFIQV